MAAASSSSLVDSIPIHMIYMPRRQQLPYTYLVSLLLDPSLVQFIIGGDEIELSHHKHADSLDLNHSQLLPHAHARPFLEWAPCILNGIEPRSIAWSNNKSLGNELLWIPPVARVVVQPVMIAENNTTFRRISEGNA